MAETRGAGERNRIEPTLASERLRDQECCGARFHPFNEPVMDLSAIIGQLRTELQGIERVIAQLEKLQQNDDTMVPGTTQKRRGRKSMGPAERVQVGLRMKRYWENRRHHEPSPQPTDQQRQR